MTDYNDFSDWPTIEVRVPKAGGKFFTKHGALIAYVGTDGSLQVLQDMNPLDIQSWESFGITDPGEQRTMELKMKELMTQLTGKYKPNV